MDEVSLTETEALLLTCCCMAGMAVSALGIVMVLLNL